MCRGALIRQSRKAGIHSTCQLHSTVVIVMRQRHRCVVLLP
jgi:hypothetical protein